MITKLFQSGLLATIAKAAAAVLALAFNLAVVFFYTTNDASDVLVTLTLLFILSVAFRFGCDQFIVRLIARKGTLTTPSKNIVLAINSSILVFTISFLLIILVVNSFTYSFSDESIYLSLFSLLFYSLTQVNSFVLQGLNRPVAHIYFLNAGFFGTLLFGHYSYYIFSDFSTDEFNYETFLKILVVCTAFNYLISLLTVRIGVSYKFPFSRIIAIFKLNISYYSFSLVQITLVWLPQIILYFSLFKEQVTVYTLMHRLALVSSFVLISISSVFTPRFAKNIKNKCYDVVERDAKLFIKLAGCFSLLFVTLLAISIEPILYTLNKEDLLDKRVMWMLLLAQVVNAFTGPSLKLLQMGGEMKIARRTQSTTAIFTLVAGLILINAYGAVGAAAVCSAAIIFANIFYTVAAIRIFGLNIYGGIGFKSR